MRKHLAAFLLIAVLPLSLPACSAIGVKNPVATAQTLEQKAFALHGLYVIAEEEAADIVEQATTPKSVTTVIKQVTLISHPLAAELRDAAQGYGDVEEDLAALPSDATLTAKASAALANLQTVWARAAPPMQALISAVEQFKEH
jgi:hypothetical protein